MLRFVALCCLVTAPAFAEQAAAEDSCEKAITEILVACGEQSNGEPVEFQKCIGPATPRLQKSGCAQGTFSDSAMNAREQFEARGGRIVGDDFKRPKSIAHRLFLDKVTISYRSGGCLCG
jgi:hypothetical protein